jgi:hypothetical protein
VAASSAIKAAHRGTGARISLAVLLEDAAAQNVVSVVFSNPSPLIDHEEMRHFDRRPFGANLQVRNGDLAAIEQHHEITAVFSQIAAHGVLSLRRCIHDRQNLKPVAILVLRRG